MTHTQRSALILDMTEPSTNWIRKFVQKNADQITKKRAHGLDPKRAQAFTKDAVKSHFEKLELLIVGQSVPPVVLGKFGLVWFRAIFARPETRPSGP